MLRTAWIAAIVVGLSGCGVAYNSPGVNSFAASDTKVRVVALTPESVLVANRSTYRPKDLPAVFFQTAGTGGGLRGAGVAPTPVIDPTQKPLSMETRLPPRVVPGPYRMGVGDVVLLATPQVGSTVEQLTGLLAASNSRQGYTVQDDGTIAIPNVGRVQVAGMTLEEAEATLFQRLVESQIDPTFSLEIAEFNSKKVSIGGAVANPTVAPISLTPLFLDEALAAAGGITVEDQDYASVRIYRDETLYQIPLNELYSNRGLQRIALVDGDSVFVDTAYELDLAQAYFAEQIQLSQFRQTARIAALNELNAEVNIRRSALQESRQNYMTRLDLDSVERDYVYLTGEVSKQTRYPLPFGKTSNLADALYGSGGVPTATGNVKEIYVLRGSPDPREFSAVTAWRLDGRDATNFILATRFELRPNDVIFVAEQPVTKWSRVVQQITPTLINTGVAAASN
ncbi:polysaccharide biosynthesis/export family protein [Puniceibacterium sp. IMCC21224]|uniref:polysaccharide biosynthesis/export family protein n=1 Tax=Puniceibacterium sp. IMCC21224 TaxID=1618204 RepID=UPI00065D912E|nr:polysaccharide biosynthesis/export family protein [Puniceibacterium sp. IMCC21224]KMK68028.1 periplasmic protein involved in polysaccharide export [Puniceibacterium sp. IMCC21224]